MNKKNNQKEKDFNKDELIRKLNHVLVVFSGMLSKINDEIIDGEIAFADGLERARKLAMSYDPAGDNNHLDGVIEPVMIRVGSFKERPRPPKRKGVYQIEDQRWYLLVLENGDLSACYYSEEWDLFGDYHGKFHSCQPVNLRMHVSPF